MTVRFARRRLVRPLALAAVAVCLWLGTSIPSGFPISQIAMFAGPGIVLALTASWASHAFAPKTLVWRTQLRAAIWGAVLFPPLIALYFAWGGSFGGAALLALLVLSTWFALVGGFAIAAVRFLAAPDRVYRRARLPRPPHPYELAPYRREPNAERARLTVLP